MIEKFLEVSGIFLDHILYTIYTKIFLYSNARPLLFSSHMIDLFPITPQAGIQNQEPLSLSLKIISSESGRTFLLICQLQFKYFKIGVKL